MMSCQHQQRYHGRRTPLTGYPADRKERLEEIRTAIENAKQERDNPASSVGTRCAAGNFILCRRAQIALLTNKN